MQKHNQKYDIMVATVYNGSIENLMVEDKMQLGTSYWGGKLGTNTISRVCVWDCPDGQKGSIME